MRAAHYPPTGRFPVRAQGLATKQREPTEHGGLSLGIKAGYLIGPPNRHFFSDDGYSVDWKTDEGSSVVRKFHEFLKI